MKKLTLISFLLTLSTFWAGCGENKPVATSEEKPAAPAAEKHLTIKDFGPRETKAGEGFNLQPNGVSALWFSTENATLTTVVVFNETTLPSSIQNDGKLVTAGVPKALFGKAGESPVYLLDKATGEKSNAMKFVVK
jgi:hypothetical protein